MNTPARSSRPAGDATDQLREAKMATKKAEMGEVGKRHSFPLKLSTGGAEIPSETWC